MIELLHKHGAKSSEVRSFVKRCGQEHGERVEEFLLYFVAISDELVPRKASSRKSKAKKKPRAKKKTAKKKKRGAKAKRTASRGAAAKSKSRKSR